MRKRVLLLSIASLCLMSCTVSTDEEKKNDVPEPTPSPTVVTNQEILKDFFDDATISYSFQAKVTDYSSYYGVASTALNYLDVAGDDTHFSLTKYKQVYDNYGTINRNDVDSDIRYVKYSYEGRDDVVASTYLSLGNEIGYSVSKDDYGYKTYWEDSFALFFKALAEYDVNEFFSSDDEKTYSFDFAKDTEESSVLKNQILYQTGYLSPSGITSLDVRELKFTIEKGSVTGMSIQLVDDQDSSIYQSIQIEGTVKAGETAKSDVKTEEKSSGEELSDLKSAFDRLKAYNFDFELKVIVSTLEQDAYHTTAQADGKKIVSDRFAYVESSQGLEYYVSPLDDGNLYKTMQTVSGGKLSDILPTFDISTFFFTKASKTTYIKANKAKRVSISSNDFSCYAPFGLEFSSVSITLDDDSLLIVGKSGSYEFDISYTNIGKVSDIEFTSPSVLGYGDYLSDNSWSDTYQSYITAFKNEFGLTEDNDLYTLFNHIPTYQSYRLGSMSVGAMKVDDTTAIYGIVNKYSSTYKRDEDLTGISKFYLENGYQLTMTYDDGSMRFSKTITFNENTYTLSLTVFETSVYEIPAIGIFPLISK